MNIIYFEESAPSGKLTPDQHSSRLDNIGRKIQGLSKVSDQEADAIFQRDRAIQIAWSNSARSKSLVKVPDGVVLTPQELELANWIFEYAKQASISTKEAMVCIFDFLKKNPDFLSHFTTGEVSFSEFSEPAIAVGASDEWNNTQLALHKEMQLRIYQTASGCSFNDAITAIF